MRLKSFYAKTMTEAMQMVRDTLGEDAIIVATREENGGKAVRVTAAIDPDSYNDTPIDRDDNGSGDGMFGIRDPDAGLDSNDTADGWLQYDDEDEDGTSVAEEITDAMLHHNLPEDVMDHIISCATVIGLENSGVALIAALEHLFTFRPLPTRAIPKPIIMVGPPGAGKTLAVAKLATRATMNGLRAGVITADTVRSGGVEQLQGFTKLLRTRLLTATDSASLARAVQDLPAMDQIIIDTPGINPFNKDDVRMLARLIGSADMEVQLVLPAGLDSSEAGDMARAFAAMGAKAILSTRVDMARRMGGLLSAAHYGGLALTDASNTPKVADGLYMMSPKNLAKLLMPRAYQVDKASGIGQTELRRTGT